MNEPFAVRRRGLLARTIIAVTLTGALAVLWAPAAHAADTTLTPKVESWYQPDPTCGLPTGCLLTQLSSLLPLPISPTDPYPAGTLHVGFASQKETARTYLAFDFSALGALTSARLDIPLDTTATDGSIAPQNAKVQACLATGDITAVAGSTSSPPTFDCDEHVSLTYAATPQPHLTGDLQPILAGLETTTGIALLPDVAKLTATDVWQVAFSAHDRTGTNITGPATITATEGAAASSSPPSTKPAQVATPTPAAAAPTSDAPAAVIPGPAITLPDTGPATLDQPSVTPPSVASAPQPQTVVAAPTPVAAISPSSDGFQYPVVLLFPLVLLVVVPAAARALTRDLDDSDLIDDAI